MRALFRNTGFLLGLLALFIRILMGISPTLAVFYEIYIFKLARLFLDNTFALLPFSASYILIPVVLLILFYRFPSFSNLRKGKAWKRSFVFILNFVGLLFFLFNILWAFNYEKESLESRLNLDESLDLTAEIAKSSYLDAMENGAKYRSAALGDDTLLNVMMLPFFYDENDINKLVISTLENFGYKVVGSPKVRYIKPKGILRKLGIAGIYNPFTGEPNVDSSFGVLQNAFTTAHELAHAYGITSEAEANFIAYLSLMNSEDPLLKYAAEYTLWRHLASEVVKRLNQEDLDYVIASIPPVLKADREAIRVNSRKYSQWFPRLADTVNDTYLKAQGIAEGSDDYDRFINLLLAYNKKTQID